MSAALHRRARDIRARAAVRAWEYRQRDHAHGTWFRLRRVLADAATAHTIDDADAAALAAEGWAAEPVGAELEPARTLVFVTAERLAALASRRPVAVRLDAELLAARHLALVRFGSRER